MRLSVRRLHTSVVNMHVCVCLSVCLSVCLLKKVSDETYESKQAMRKLTRSISQKAAIEILGENIFSFIVRGDAGAFFFFCNTTAKNCMCATLCMCATPRGPHPRGQLPTPRSAKNRLRAAPRPRGDNGARADAGGPSAVFKRSGRPAALGLAKGARFNFFFVQVIGVRQHWD
jgi:hypothetical protein